MLRWAVTALVGTMVFAEVAMASVATDAQPRLLSARSARGHIVVSAVLGELTPDQVQVASRPSTGRDGVLLRKNVRLRESLAAGVEHGTGRIRWRSKHALSHGVYWVQVSAVQTDGVTDCLPHGRRCGELWSNVLRVVVHA
jgi:hypothetical protein